MFCIEDPDGNNRLKLFYATASENACIHLATYRQFYFGCFVPSARVRTI